MGVDITGFIEDNVAFVFPGQGSQSIGMMNSFRDISIVTEVLEESSDVLNENLLDLIGN